MSQTPSYGVMGSYGSFTTSCMIDDLYYSITHTDEEWHEFLNHSSTLYDTDFRKIMKFLEDNGKSKMLSIRMRREMELLVVLHYKITPMPADLVDLMTENDRKRYYLRLYKTHPMDPMAQKYYVMQLEEQLKEQKSKYNELSDDYDELNSDTSKTIMFKDSVIRKLKSINRKLKAEIERITQLNERLKRIETKIELHNWRNSSGCTPSGCICTEPSYDAL